MWNTEKRSLKAFHKNGQADADVPKIDQISLGKAQERIHRDKDMINTLIFLIPFDKQSKLPLFHFSSYDNGSVQKANRADWTLICAQKKGTQTASRPRKTWQWTCPTYGWYTVWMRTRWAQNPEMLLRLWKGGTSGQNRACWQPGREVRGWPPQRVGNQWCLSDQLRERTFPYNGKETMKQKAELFSKEITVWELN